MNCAIGTMVGGGVAYPMRSTNILSSQMSRIAVQIVEMEK